MGIYYSSSLSYGLKVDEDVLAKISDGEGTWRTETMENLLDGHEGLGFREAGSYDEDGDILVVVQRLDQEAGGRDGGVFGAFRLDQLEQPTLAEISSLRQFAEVLGQDFDPAWYATFDCS